MPGRDTTRKQQRGEDHRNPWGSPYGSAEQGAAVAEIAEESPEAAGLVYGLITASMDATHRTMDSLYEQEREHRQALEVLIDEVLDRLDGAHMGSAREYEAAVKPLRVGIYGRMSELAARHRENRESD